ncbi:MAG: SGNH/GDSL hydrolase family protein [Actinobacteria bacterium]|nr:MAG: SGNH/GDSL hydrolase family protein [Actinomycetota bacterium]
MPVHVLVLGDSLTYHGPERAELPADPRLWPNVMARALCPALGRGSEVRVDLVARMGWTARDGWWALTKDPRCWGEVLPRADAVVLALGQMDQLPAAVPTYLREGIPYLRPASVRTVVRRVYRASAPPVMRLTGGPWRQLPQPATDAYLGRIVQAVRYWRPGVPIVLLGPSPFDSPYYPAAAGHAPAVAAARSWSIANEVSFVDVDPLVLPSLRDGTANADGLHWSWRSHDLVGRALAATLGDQLREAASV